MYIGAGVMHCVCYNTFSGPFTLHVGFIYTGLSDGRIIRFDSGLKAYATVQRLGEPPYDKCGKLHLRSSWQWIQKWNCKHVTRHGYTSGHINSSFPTIPEVLWSYREREKVFFTPCGSRNIIILHEHGEKDAIWTFQKRQSIIINEPK